MIFIYIGVGDGWVLPLHPAPGRADFGAVLGGVNLLFEIVRKSTELQEKGSSLISHT